jgi:hypothetical protein
MSVDKLLMTKRNILNLKTIIKDSTDVLPFSIIEIFSGDVRIDTGQTDFDGIDIFVISSGSIIDNKILIKIYGIKCEVFENEYMINDNLKLIINLEYRETTYNHLSQMGDMFKKLNIIFNLELREE